MFYAFLWNNKGDKVKRKIMINQYVKRGMKMLDITYFSKTLKSVWIKKYLDPENRGKWKCFLDLQLREYGGNIVPKGKNTKDIKISDLFVKEILETGQRFVLRKQ